MKKTYITTMPNHIGAFLKASECFAALGVNITRVSYNKAVDSHTLFIDAEGNEEQLKATILIQALLFGIWHVVTPLHNLIDGDIGVGAFVALSLGYIVLAGIMGIKWALMGQMTGSLYTGLADHFFNNCIATNLLHVSTESGIDEMMIVRVLIAQLMSFFIVHAMWRNHSRKALRST